MVKRSRRTDQIDKIKLIKLFLYFSLYQNHQWRMKILIYSESILILKEFTVVKSN